MFQSKKKTKNFGQSCTKYQNDIHELNSLLNLQKLSKIILFYGPKMLLKIFENF